MMFLKQTPRIFKGLASTKVFLVNTIKVLNLQKPIGSFLRPKIITNYFLMNLLYDSLKAFCTLIFYLWEWILMIGGVFVFLLSLYLYLFPTPFLLATFPSFNLVFEVLDIEQPLSIVGGIKDFFFHPINWIIYFNDKIIFYLDLNNYWFFKWIVTGFNLLNQLVNILEILSRNIVYYSFVGPFILISNIYFVIKTTFFGTILIGFIFFINKCYLIYDTIVQASLPLYQLIPGMPKMFYFIIASLNHAIILPLQDLARAANGSGITFLWSLIPSEKDLIILSLNTMEASDTILRTICANELLELTNFTNPIIKFTARVLMAPVFAYFKIGGGFCGLVATWLTRWL